MEARNRIFIGSSGENIKYAHAVQENLFRERNFEIVVWDQGIFPPTNYVLDSLVSELMRADFAAFILAPDDLVTVRDKELKAPRDNVIFELGLFIGKLGRERVFILVPLQLSDLKLPSDLDGVTFCVYESYREDNNVVASVAPASRQIVRWANNVVDIHNSGVNFPRKIVKWDDLIGYVDNLFAKVSQTPRNGGFSIDAIIGVAHGGIMVADLLGRRYNSNVPLVCLAPDRHTEQPETSFNTDLNRVLTQGIKDGGYRRILLVEDMTNSGKTLQAAKSYLLTNLDCNVEIRTAAAIVNSELVSSADYYGIALKTAGLMTPFAASVIPNKK